MYLNPQLQTFVEQHGGPPVCPPTTPGWGSTVMLLRDGAWIAVNGPVAHQPPADPRQRLIAEKRYWTCLRDRAEAELAKYRAAMGLVPGPGSAEPWRWPGESDWFGAHLGQPIRNDAHAVHARLRALALQARDEAAELDAKLNPVFA